jgi:hypothetical protein
MQHEQELTSSTVALRAGAIIATPFLSSLRSSLFPSGRQWDGHLSMYLLASEVPLPLQLETKWARPAVAGSLKDATLGPTTGQANGTTRSSVV